MPKNDMSAPSPLQHHRPRDDDRHAPHGRGDVRRLRHRRGDRSHDRVSGGRNLVVAVLGIETKQKPLEAIAPSPAEDASAGSFKIA